MNRRAAASAAIHDSHAETRINHPSTLKTILLLFFYYIISFHLLFFSSYLLLLTSFCFPSYSFIIIIVVVFLLSLLFTFTSITYKIRIFDTHMHAKILGWLIIYNYTPISINGRLCFRRTYTYNVRKYLRKLRQVFDDAVPTLMNRKLMTWNGVICQIFHLTNKYDI